MMLTLVALKLASGRDTLNEFILDVINEWQLLLPTIVAGHDLPELCRTPQRVLCLSYADYSNEMAERIALMHLDRKQDGIIFTKGEGQQKLFEKVTRLAPTIWTSNCPAFMPLEYVGNINLRLDSNVVFYEEHGPEKYRLVDIFTVKGAQLMKIDMCIWEYLKEFTFLSQKNRWDRRSDLQGANFVNGVKNNSGWTQIVRDDTGKVVGSLGYFQSMLFHLAERLNLNIMARDITNVTYKTYENGSWKGWIGALHRKEIDICSIGVGIKLERTAAVDFTIPTHRDTITLIGPNTEGDSVNVWAYIEVFGFYQWWIFLTLMVTFIIITTIFNYFSQYGSKKTWISFALNATETACMLVIQMGDHSNVKSLGKRLLMLTASMLTLFMFVCYTNDITAEMTSGPPGIPVINFEDVIHSLMFFGDTVLRKVQDI